MSPAVTSQAVSQRLGHLERLRSWEQPRFPPEWKQCQTREIKPHSLQPDVLDAGPLNSDKPRTSHSQTTHVPCVAGSHA